MKHENLGRLFPSGTVEPQTCPPGLVIDRFGAASSSECDVCPAGKMCPVGAIVPQPCWPGHYCPFSENVTACPPTTYNFEEGGQNLTDCDPCPAGYWCYDDGMAEFDVSPCPVGYFCPEATWQPVSCPPGTFRYDMIARNVNCCSLAKCCFVGLVCSLRVICSRDEEGAGNITDCHLCPAGFYCPSANGTIAGIMCDEGAVTVFLVYNFLCLSHFKAA